MYDEIPSVRGQTIWKDYIPSSKVDQNQKLFQAVLSTPWNINMSNQVIKIRYVIQIIQRPEKQAFQTEKVYFISGIMRISFSFSMSFITINFIHLQNLQKSDAHSCVVECSWIVQINAGKDIEIKIILHLMHPKIDLYTHGPVKSRDQNKHQSRRQVGSFFIPLCCDKSQPETKRKTASDLDRSSVLDSRGAAGAHHKDIFNDSSPDLWCTPRLPSYNSTCHKNSSDEGNYFHNSLSAWILPTLDTAKEWWALTNQTEQLATRQSEKKNLLKKEGEITPDNEFPQMMGHDSDISEFQQNKGRQTLWVGDK